jgi:hypothetical protein
MIKAKASAKIMPLEPPSDAPIIPNKATIADIRIAVLNQLNMCAYSE